MLFRRLLFVPNSAYLILVTSSYLHVWNLLTCSVWWSYKADVVQLAVDPDGTRFVAAVCTKTAVNKAVIQTKKIEEPEEKEQLEKNQKQKHNKKKKQQGLTLGHSSLFASRNSSSFSPTVPLYPVRCFFPQPSHCLEAKAPMSACSYFLLGYSRSMFNYLVL